MYKKMVPFHGYDGKPHTFEVQFNLDEREVFKLLNEFKVVFDWQKSLAGEPRDLETEEVVEFYTAFEDILLAAYGKMSEDGLEFDKSGVYAFKQSALFNACMKMYVSEPAETDTLLKNVMPKGLNDLVKKATANYEALEKKEGVSNEAKAEIARLRAQLLEAEINSTKSPAAVEASPS